MFYRNTDHVPRLISGLAIDALKKSRILVRGIDNQRFTILGNPARNALPHVEGDRLNGLLFFTQRHLKIEVMLLFINEKEGSHFCFHQVGGGLHGPPPDFLVVQRGVENSTQLQKEAESFDPISNGPIPNALTPDGFWPGLLSIEDPLLHTHPFLFKGLTNFTPFVNKKLRSSVSPHSSVEVIWQGCWKSVIAATSQRAPLRIKTPPRPPFLGVAMVAHKILMIRLITLWKHPCRITNVKG